MARRNTKTYQWQRYRVEEQVTQPLPVGNLWFRRYLETHHLNSLEAARLTDVPYAITWNIEQNKPIRPQSAALVRTALLRATGVAYTGPIMVHSDESTLHEQPTRRRRRPHETV